MIKPWGKSIGSAGFFEILRFDIIIAMFETKLYLKAKPSCWTIFCVIMPIPCLNNVMFVSDHLMTANMDPCLYCPSQSIFKISFIYNNQN